MTIALCLFALQAQAEPAGEPARLRLRYGWSPDQAWRASQSVLRETKLADDVQREHGIARFSYYVRAGDSAEDVRLEARMLSQETAAGVSPLDFSAIRFGASIDARGRQRDAHYTIDEKERAVADGDEDALARRRMLRDIATAWRDAVFWFPELPERSLSAGEAFAVEQERDLEGAQPGVEMRVRSTRSYRLIAVEGDVARFRVEEKSTLDAASQDAGIASQQRSEGEASFDLSLGMWTRHQLVSDQRARFSGAPEGIGSGEATSRSVTTIEMSREEADPAH